MKKLFVKKQLFLLSMTKRFNTGWVVTLILIMFISVLTVHAQILDELFNPTISLTLKHPPELGFKVNKIAFGPASGTCADQIIEALISDFVSNQIEVVDRQNLNAILAEHNFTLSGYVDQASAAALGKILGPSALIFVKVQRCTTQQDKVNAKETYYDSKTKSNYQVIAYYSKTRAFLKASIQAVDLATGRIFAAQTFDYSPEKANKSYDGYPEAPAEFDVLDIAIQTMVRDVHRMFLPWSEQTNLIYYDDKSCNLKQSFEALQAGDFDRAFDISLHNLETCKNTPNVKDKVLGHAYYNVGMSYMIRDEYDKALDYFHEAARIRPGEIVSKAIADCQKAKELMISMQKIEQKATFEAEKNQAESEKAAKAETASMLTNADIIQMTKEKLPDAIIIQKIKKSKCKFDTSPDALSTLNKSGVSEKVIIAMMENQ